jgi:integrase
MSGSPALTAAAATITERIRSLAERPAPPAVAQLIDRRLAISPDDRTMKQRLEVWRELIGALTLDKLDADVIFEARAVLARIPAQTYLGMGADGNRIFRPKERDKTPATVNRYAAALSGLFTWAIGERLTPRGWVNPCRGVKRLREAKERVRFLDEGERTRLLEACKVSKYPRMRALVLMAMTTGARQGELLALRWRDVDLTAGRAAVDRSKNGDRRTLIVLPHVVAALTPFAGDADRFVFGSYRTRHRTPASIDTAWWHALERAQVKDFRFHDLRHCCASYLAQAGKPLNVIKEVLGHRKIDMTLRYAHLTVDATEEAMQDALGSIGV